MICYGYAFGYTRRTPRKPMDLASVPTIRAQILILQDPRTRTENSLFHQITSYATNRSKSFHETNEFRAMIDSAASDAAVVMLDIRELFSHTRPGVIGAAVTALNAISVNVIDASTHTIWQTMSAAEKLLLARSATAVHAIRSLTIKEGLKRSDRKRKPSPPRNRLAANRSRKQQARHHAEKLRPFVLDFLKAVSDGKSPSPSKLGRALNEAGKLSPRGNSWSHNTAKGLLNRLGLSSIAGGEVVVLPALSDSELSLELQEKLSPP